MDTEALFQKFRHISHLMKPRGRRGRPGRGGLDAHFGASKTEQGFAADPTRGQGRILAALKLQDGVPTKDLAFILGMRVASLNELLVKLERSELISREPSEEDKRVILIHLTDEGRNTEQFRPERPDAFGSLSEDEREQLGAYLDRIIEQLEAEREANADEEAPDEEFERWSQQARARMGDEQFDRWMSRMAEYAPDGYAGRYGRGGRGRGGEGRGRRGHGHGRGQASGHEAAQGDFRNRHRPRHYGKGDGFDRGYGYEERGRS
ncbi:MAG: MarR family winged helix-turn-helix transcriptional regulator [Gulosibacter sp.]|uniref:MarR family winged helix-turn-helix transcriptional regulator n=1 Tax=Gulosibacter sp. TaxID=2817531 RepID=UPI003F91D195